MEKTQPGGDANFYFQLEGTVPADKLPDLLSNIGAVASTLAARLDVYIPVSTPDQSPAGYRLRQGEGSAEIDPADLVTWLYDASQEKMVPVITLESQRSFARTQPDLSAKIPARVMNVLLRNRRKYHLIEFDTEQLLFIDNGVVKGLYAERLGSLAGIANDLMVDVPNFGLRCMQFVQALHASVTPYIQQTQKLGVLAAESNQLELPYN